MRKKIVSLMYAAIITCSLLSGCGGNAASQGGENLSDQDKANKAAALIDAIYVQERNENTDDLCAQAKAAWDELTDEQKELVYGEQADPDYFGRDTGDASLDDPLNDDNIGENELLVVSFGTSFNDSRVKDIGGIEAALKAANPDWSVRRAFTSQIIINHVQARDGEKIDNMDQALCRAVDNQVKNLVILPTHLMHGAEYDELVAAVDSYRDKFESVKIAEPLLGEVGLDATVINADKEAVAVAVIEEAVSAAGYKDAAEADKDGVAFVLLGHGTSHTAKVSYSQMQTQMDKLGYSNVFIGTVEGEPKGTACEEVIEIVAQAGYKTVILRPLMVVAGDHANNDMAGDDEDSWKSLFTASGKFEKVETQIAGLGSINKIQQIYVKHAADAINAGNAVLEDGIYEAFFDTDSSMFHVCEANEGKGILTVKDGVMTIHVSLASKNILNLFAGMAEDAKKSGAKLLEPSVDTVKYSDGFTEEVHGFDIPVPYLDDEFDVALVGKKGTWYDHKVKVYGAVLKESASETPSAGISSDGTYKVDVTMEGGSGRAVITSPAKVTVKDGKAVATIEWSSSNFDYMIVGGEKYLPINQGGNSTFEIPVYFDMPVDVIADTVAMGNPHEIAYVLIFNSRSAVACD